MISKKYFFILLATLVVFNSCNLFKKSGKITADNNAINLDTVEIADEPPPMEYQASATRINDILHTKLDVSFNWEKQYLYGKATITVKPYYYSTSTLELDAREMELKEVSLVKTVTEDGDPKKDLSVPQEKKTIRVPLEYKYENDVIKIKLDKIYQNNEEYTVYIDYVSKPNELKKKGGSDAISEDKGLYFINPDGKEKDKPQQIWTQGETQSNSVWFPTIDRPNERMTDEIYITVDKKYTTLSNGELAFSTDNGDNTRTDCWKMELPHAPYLVMMARGEFAVTKERWHDKEVSYYVEKEYAPYTKAIFGNTPEMLEFFSTRLGVEYAWNKYAQVVVRDYVSGAMENTTATLHGEFLQRTDRELLDKNFEDVISHELFHQWFGDLVTCESWSNLPLNESFATYGEYLWKEHKYGRDEADLISEESRSGYLAEASRKQVNLIRFQYNDKEDMFDAHSYNKGGQVLHMLRKYVGDEAFFASLKLYLENNKFTSVEIHNLRLAFEKVTGEDLNWFFNQWFFSVGHPNLTIKTTYDTINKKSKVQIVQTQDLKKMPLFKIPMYVDIYSNGKKERHRIVVSKVDETFEFDAVHPDLVNVDAEKMLLCTKYEEKPVKTWIYQYKNAPLYLDRSEALKALVKNANDSTALETLLSALNDPFWKLRSYVINNLKDISVGHEKQIKKLLVNIAKTDKKVGVRADALNYLSSNYKDQDLKPLFENALSAPSYSVLMEGLVGLTKLNPEEGLKLTKKYESEKSTDVLFVIADLYANYGNESNNEFFVSSANKFSGFNKIGFVSLYGLFLQRVNNETVISGANLLKGIAQSQDENKWTAYYAKKVIRDLATFYEVKMNDNTEKLKKAKSKTDTDSIKLTEKIAQDKAQEEKIMAIYNDIK
jgi:aminopeptidase N